MYCTMKPLLAQAMEDGQGVPAFNIHALEVVPVMAKAADAVKCPVILQVSVSTAKYIGYSLLASIVKKVSEDMTVDVALHLDHATDLEDIRGALDGGFSSVMYDGSKLPFEENIANTLKAVELARNAGASIEAELGIVGRGKSSKHIHIRNRRMRRSLYDVQELMLWLSESVPIMECIKPRQISVWIY